MDGVTKEKEEQMAKIEIPVQVYMDDLEEMIDELKQLQTYKLYEGAEQLLVSCDEVVKVFEKHLRTEVGKPEIIIRCKDCRHSFLHDNGEKISRICGLTRMCGTTPDNWFCADAERKEQDDG